MLPVQVRAILLLAILIVASFFFVRSQLIPESFGQTGHFRQNAIREVAAQEPHFADERACMPCHPGIEEAKVRSAHSKVWCEVCHGPAHIHASDPARHRPPRRTIGSAFCLQCHRKNASKPDDFPQIDEAEHRPGIQCRECHNPHAPETEEF
jgi:hypothetical protein